MGASVASGPAPRSTSYAIVPLTGSPLTSAGGGCQARRTSPSPASAVSAAGAAGGAM
jgi:hypothetical protein